MSFRDFTPRGNERRGSDENGNGVHRPRNGQQPQQLKNNHSLRRSTSTSRARAMTTPSAMSPSHSLPFCRSKSDSTSTYSQHPQHYQPQHPYSSYYANANDDSDDQEQHEQQQQQRQSLLVQQREEEYALRVMQQREEDLRDIHRKMHTVNEIYKDLGDVVDQQQEQIDQVENKFEGAADATRRGLEQVEKANARAARGGWLGRGKKSSKGEEKEQPPEAGSDKAKRYLLLHYLSKSASEVAKMVTVCAGSGSASYVDGESWIKKK